MFVHEYDNCVIFAQIVCYFSELFLELKPYIDPSTLTQPNLTPNV